MILILCYKPFRLVGHELAELRQDLRRRLGRHEVGRQTDAGQSTGHKPKLKDFTLGKNYLEFALCHSQQNTYYEISSMICPPIQDST